MNGKDDWPEKPTWDNQRIAQASVPRKSAAVTQAAMRSEEDKECSICFDAEVSIIFDPCGHGACTDCVTKIRREVIFKADKGMKCPFCRSHISAHLKSDTTGGSKAKQALKQTTESAKIAALSSQSQQQNRITSSAVRALEPPPERNLEWTCMRCKNNNSMSCKHCTQCRLVAPTFVLQQLTASRAGPVDIMKANPATIRSWARVKLHPNFNPAFAEAGMPFDIATANFGGTEQTIMAAIRQGNCKRLARVMEAILGQSDIKELAVDFYGNYTLQDCIEVAARLRNTAKELLHRNDITQAQHDEAMGLVGKRNDWLRRISMQVQLLSDGILTHTHANYVFNKILDVGDGKDLIVVTSTIFEQPYKYLVDVKNVKHAIVKGVKAVDKLAKFAFEPGEARDECAAHLNQLCENLLAMEGRFESLLNYELGGVMILDAAQGGLPNNGALKVLSEVVGRVNELRLSPSGVSVLRKFMTLESRDAECRDIFITHVCIMAQNLSPKYAETADPRFGGPELVQRMLELLSQEDDQICDDWVCHIVSMLVADAPQLVAVPASKALLTYSLDLPVVANEVEVHLESIRQTCGNAVWRSIKAELSQHTADQKSKQISPASSQLTLTAEPSSDHPSADSVAVESSSQEVVPDAPVPSSVPKEEEVDLSGFTMVQTKGAKKKGKLRKGAQALEPETSANLQNGFSSLAQDPPAQSNSASSVENASSSAFGNVPASAPVAATQVAQAKSAPYQTPAQKRAAVLRSEEASAKNKQAVPVQPIASPARSNLGNPLQTFVPETQSMGGFLPPRSQGSGGQQLTGQGAYPGGQGPEFGGYNFGNQGAFPEARRQEQPQPLPESNSNDDGGLDQDFLADLLPGINLGDHSSGQSSAPTTYSAGFSMPPAYSSSGDRLSGMQPPPAAHISSGPPPAGFGGPRPAFGGGFPQTPPGMGLFPQRPLNSMAPAQYNPRMQPAQYNPQMQSQSVLVTPYNTGATHQVQPAARRGSGEANGFSGQGFGQPSSRDERAPSQVAQQSTTTFPTQQRIPIHLNTHPPIQPPAAKKAPAPATFSATGSQSSGPEPAFDDQGWTPAAPKRASAKQNAAPPFQRAPSGGQTASQSKGPAQKGPQKAAVKPAQLPVDAPVKPRRASMGTAGDEASPFGGVASTQPQGTWQNMENEPAWTCATCSYVHEGGESRFLTCALCYSERP